MKEKIVNFSRPVPILKRKDGFNASGLDVFQDSLGQLVLTPITVNGNLASSRIIIPNSNIEEFLKSVAEVSNNPITIHRVK